MFTNQSRSNGFELVSVLSNVLERLMNRNDAFAESQPRNSGSFLKFQSSYSPDVSILSYMERIRQYSECSESCFIIALIFIDRLIERKNLIVTTLNVHRLVIASLLIAAKYHDDLFFNNAFYAKLGGLPLQELNQLEVIILHSLDFTLFVDCSIYCKYSRELNNYLIFLKSIPSVVMPSATMMSNPIMTDAAAARGDTAATLVHAVNMNVPSHSLNLHVQKLQRGANMHQPTHYLSSVPPNSYCHNFQIPQKHFSSEAMGSLPVNSHYPVTLVDNHAEFYFFPRPPPNSTNTVQLLQPADYWIDSYGNCRSGPRYEQDMGLSMCYSPTSTMDRFPTPDNPTNQFYTLFSDKLEAPSQQEPQLYPVYSEFRAVDISGTDRTGYENYCTTSASNGEVHHAVPFFSECGGSYGGYTGQGIHDVYRQNLSASGIRCPLPPQRLPNGFQSQDVGLFDQSGPYQRVSNGDLRRLRSLEIVHVSSTHCGGDLGGRCDSADSSLTTSSSVSSHQRSQRRGEKLPRFDNSFRDRGSFHPGRKKNFRRKSFGLETMPGAVEVL